MHLQVVGKYNLSTFLTRLELDKEFQQFAQLLVAGDLSLSGLKMEKVLKIFRMLRLEVSRMFPIL